jgi:hypothetical protein
MPKKELRPALINHQVASHSRAYPL